MNKLLKKFFILFLNYICSASVITGLMTEVTSAGTANVLVFGSSNIVVLGTSVIGREELLSCEVQYL